MLRQQDVDERPDEPAHDELLLQDALTGHLGGKRLLCFGRILREGGAMEAEHAAPRIDGR